MICARQPSVQHLKKECCKPVCTHGPQARSTPRATSTKIDRKTERVRILGASFPFLPPPTKLLTFLDEGTGDGSRQPHILFGVRHRCHSLESFPSLPHPSYHWCQPSTGLKLKTNTGQTAHCSGVHMSTPYPTFNSLFQLTAELLQQPQQYLLQLPVTTSTPQDWLTTLATHLCQGDYTPQPFPSPPYTHYYLPPPSHTNPHYNHQAHLYINHWYTHLPHLQHTHPLFLHHLPLTTIHPSLLLQFLLTIHHTGYTPTTHPPYPHHHTYIPWNSHPEWDFDSEEEASNQTDTEDELPPTHP